MKFSLFKKSEEDSPHIPAQPRRHRKWIIWLLFIAFWVLYYWWGR